MSRSRHVASPPPGRRFAVAWIVRHRQRRQRLRVRVHTTALPARHDCHSVHMGATRTSTLTMSPDACGSERSDTRAWRGPVISTLRMHSSYCKDPVGHPLLHGESRRMLARPGHESLPNFPGTSRTVAACPQVLTAVRTACRSSSSPSPFSDDVEITTGKAAGRLRIFSAVSSSRRMAAGGLILSVLVSTT